MKCARRSSGRSASRSAASSGDISLRISLALSSGRSRSSAAWYEGCSSSKVSAARSSSRASSTAARSSGDSSCTRSAMSAGWSSSSLVRGTARRTELSSVCLTSTSFQSIRCGRGFWRLMARRSLILPSPTRRRIALLEMSTPTTCTSAPMRSSWMSLTRMTLRPSVSTSCLSRKVAERCSSSGSSSRALSAARGTRSKVPDSSKLVMSGHAAHRVLPRRRTPTAVTRGYAWPAVVTTRSCTVPAGVSATSRTGLPNSLLRKNTGLTSSAACRPRDTQKPSSRKAPCAQQEGDPHSSQL